MGKVKVFVDTCIVLDYLTGRMKDGIAEKVMQAADSKKYELCISILSAVNILYIAKKYQSILGPDKLQDMFTIFSSTVSQWELAQLYKIEDFEDALQLSCAVENDCRILITRDKHYYSNDVSPIWIMTPDEFISAIS